MASKQKYFRTVYILRLTMRVRVYVRLCVCVRAAVCVRLCVCACVCLCDASTLNDSVLHDGSSWSEKGVNIGGVFTVEKYQIQTVNTLIFVLMKNDSYELFHK